MPISVSEYENLAGEMLKLYEEAENDMLARVSKRLAKGVTQPGWTEKKYAEIRNVRKELSDRVDELKSGRVTLSEAIVRQAYTGSAVAFINEAQQFTDWAGTTRLSPNSTKVLSILSELRESLDAADRVILRKANDAYADIVGRVSAKVATGTTTVRQAVRDEVQQFADRGISSFVDKAGRSWEMSTYAEMATLTAIEKATVEGYCDTMRSYGFDLAVISSHVGACPLCVAWENVIVSVSGDSWKYHSLADAEAAGCFHPRCLHHLSTYYEGISKNTRSEPRAVQPPSAAYTARSKQRSLERNIRKWKRVMASAPDAQTERNAYAHVRETQAKLRTLIGDYNSSTPQTTDWLPRKYWREGGRVKLSEQAKKLPSFKLTSHPGRVIIDATKEQNIVPVAALPSTYESDQKFFARYPIIGDNGIEKGVKGTNPNFDVYVNNEWSNNCQRCVSCYEARRRGYSVVAKPCSDPSYDDIGRNPAIVYGEREHMNKVYDISDLMLARSGEKEITRQSTKETLEQKIRDSGNGSRFIIEGYWEYNKRGHVFIAENIKGKIHYFDPQSGNMNCKSYFDIMEYKSLGYFRIDDKPFNERILECVTIDD